MGCMVILGGCGDKDNEDSADEVEAVHYSKAEHIELYPETYCAFLDRCQPDTLADSYEGSVATCETRFVEWLEDRLPDCEYDGGASATCLNALPTADCAEWTDPDSALQDACGSIIDC